MLCLQRPEEGDRSLETRVTDSWANKRVPVLNHLSSPTSPRHLLSVMSLHYSPSGILALCRLFLPESVIAGALSTSPSTSSMTTVSIMQCFWMKPDDPVSLALSSPSVLVMTSHLLPFPHLGRLQIISDVVYSQWWRGGEMKELKTDRRSSIPRLLCKSGLSLTTGAGQTRPPSLCNRRGKCLSRHFRRQMTVDTTTHPFPGCGSSRLKHPVSPCWVLFPSLRTQSWLCTCYEHGSIINISPLSKFYLK